MSRSHRFAEPLPPADPVAAGALPPDAGGPGGPLSGTVLPFRRTAVKPRRKRRNPWLRMLRPLATAVLLVALPSAFGVWVLTSPRFALADVEVVGAERVAVGWVERRLAPLAGRNVVRLPLAEVETALAGHPWIEGVAIRKELPNRLAVEVRERRPAALVPGTDTPGDGGLWLADAAGRPIVAAPPGAEKEYLTVLAPPPEARGGAGPEEALAEAVRGALAVSAELARSRPVWAAGLRRADALGEGEFRLHTTALPFALLVRGGEVEPRAGYLALVLPRLLDASRGIGEVDLRFAGRIVLTTQHETQTTQSLAAAPRAAADMTRRKVS